MLNLAEIFRYFLQSERSFIQLSEELEIVKAYLEIERLRLGPRLEVRIDVDEAALGILIPILSIQPLVENAIKHGLSAKPGPGLLGLRVTVLDEELCIAVEDNGLTQCGRQFRNRRRIGQREAPPATLLRPGRRYTDRFQLPGNQSPIRNSPGQTRPCLTVAHAFARTEAGGHENPHRR